MAKMNVTVDNGLDEVKLVGSEELEKKKNKKEKKSKVQNKEKKNKNKKQSYLSQVRSEMKNVTWPSKKNLVKYSLATIAMIIFLSLFFLGLSAIFDLLYALVQGWIG